MNTSTVTKKTLSVASLAKDPTLFFKLCEAAFADSCDEYKPSAVIFAGADDFIDCYVTFFTTYYDFQYPNDYFKHPQQAFWELVKALPEINHNAIPNIIDGSNHNNITINSNTSDNDIELETLPPNPGYQVHNCIHMKTAILYIVEKAIFNPLKNLQIVITQFLQKVPSIKNPQFIKFITLLTEIQNISKHPNYSTDDEKLEAIKTLIKTFQNKKPHQNLPIWTNVFCNHLITLATNSEHLSLNLRNALTDINCIATYKAVRELMLGFYKYHTDNNIAIPEPLNALFNQYQNKHEKSLHTILTRTRITLSTYKKSITHRQPLYLRILQAILTLLAGSAIYSYCTTGSCKFWQTQRTRQFLNPIQSQLAVMPRLRV